MGNAQSNNQTSLHDPLFKLGKKELNVKFRSLLTDHIHNIEKISVSIDIKSQRNPFMKSIVVILGGLNFKKFKKCLNDYFRALNSANKSKVVNEKAWDKVKDQHTKLTKCIEEIILDQDEDDDWQSLIEEDSGQNFFNI